MIELQLELYWGLFSINIQWKQFMKYQFTPFQIYWLIRTSINPLLELDTLGCSNRTSDSEQLQHRDSLLIQRLQKAATVVHREGHQLPSRAHTLSLGCASQFCPGRSAAATWNDCLHQRGHFSSSLCPFRVEKSLLGAPEGCSSHAIGQNWSSSPQTRQSQWQTMRLSHGFETIGSPPLAQPHHHSDGLRVLWQGKRKETLQCVPATQRASHTEPVLLQIFTGKPWCIALWFPNKRRLQEIQWFDLPKSHCLVRRQLWRQAWPAPEPLPGHTILVRPPTRVTRAGSCSCSTCDVRLCCQIWLELQTVFWE